MKRRSLLRTLLTLPLVALSTHLPAAARSATDIEKIRSRWRDHLARGFRAPEPTEKVEYDDSQWREKLKGLQYEVLRDEATERPFSSPLNDEKRPGIFLCAGCDLPLFSSEMKYDSGTGWPSFFTNIPGSVNTKRDFKLIWPRTEYHCARCGGHQGHVFEDGPAPTNERWCNNGVALRFLPA